MRAYSRIITRHGRYVRWGVERGGFLFSFWHCENLHPTFFLLLRQGRRRLTSCFCVKWEQLWFTSLSNAPSQLFYSPAASCQTYHWSWKNTIRICHIFAFSLCTNVFIIFFFFQKGNRFAFLELNICCMMTKSGSAAMDMLKDVFVIRVAAVSI